MSIQTLLILLFAVTLFIYAFLMALRPSGRLSTAAIAITILINIVCQAWLLSHGSYVCTYVFLGMEALEAFAVGIMNEIARKRAKAALANCPPPDEDDGYDDPDDDEDEEY